jgi:fused signal recognition particle receptor
MITLFGKPEPTLLERLKESVSKTKDALADALDTITQGGRQIDPSVLKEVENALLSADLGVKTTREILDSVKEQMARNAMNNGDQLKREIKAQVFRTLNVFGASPKLADAANGNDPRVIFIVGVNGAGKTTSIGKIANRLRQEGRSVVLCAADTFRAAAVEQLEIWAQRNGIDVIKQKSGADPAAVVFDAMTAAKARGADAVIVDTAGRLHTKSNLMAELEKMKRTAAKVIPGAPHDVLLVLDATTGPGTGSRVHFQRRRYRHRSYEAGRHRQGRHRCGHLARTGLAHPFRRHRRATQRPGAFRRSNIRRLAVQLTP